MSNDNEIEKILAESTLYDTLGGEPAVGALVIRMYDYILKDDLLGGKFVNADMTRQIRQQKQFLTMILTGTEVSKVAKMSMRAAHLKLNLKDYHFDRLIELMGRTLRDLEVAEEHIEQVLDVAQDYRGWIVISDEPRSNFLKKSSSELNSLRSSGKSNQSLPQGIQIVDSIELQLAEPTLYDRIGGNAKVTDVVNRLYTVIPEDEFVKSFFEKTDLIKQVRMMKKFLSLVLQQKAVPQIVKDSMVRAHQKLKLTDTHFSHFKRIIGDCMVAEGVSKSHTWLACEEMERFKPYIVLHDKYLKQPMAELSGSKNSMLEVLSAKNSSNSVASGFYSHPNSSGSALEKSIPEDVSASSRASNGLDSNRVSGGETARAEMADQFEAQANIGPDMAIQKKSSTNAWVAKMVGNGDISRPEREDSIDRIMAEPTLYDKIGGNLIVTEVVNQMYTIIPKDEFLKSFFVKTDLIKQIQMQKKFLTLVLQQKPVSTVIKERMKRAHVHLKLENAHFDHIKKIIADCLLSAGVSKENTALALYETEKFRNLVVLVQSKVEFSQNLWDGIDLELAECNISKETLPKTELMPSDDVKLW